MTETEIQAAFGRKALREQIFAGSKLGDNLTFGVTGAAAPDHAFGKLAGPAAVRPIPLGAGDDGHRIDMAHHEHGLEGGIAALPEKEQAPVVDNLLGHMLMYQREALFKVLVQALELLAFHFGDIGVGGRIEGNGPLQCLDIALGVKPGVAVLGACKL
ncbi:hypothetical protein SDC9_125374 [bioreactor metagenome]|uniref:Uncharacterized protein n=1 Tax=bioreactor metagenome TaxID=1076179 RepID=A0A645CN35_9ZZZZ